MTAEPPAVEDSANSKQRREAVLALMLFRAVIGLWLIASPWIVVDHDNALRITDTIAGLGVLALAALSGSKRIDVRFLQAPLALGIGFSPFVFDAGGELGLYNELILAKLLLVTSIASPSAFE